MKKVYYTIVFSFFASSFFAQTTTVWNPAGNPSTSGLWSEAPNWTGGTVPDGDFKIVFNVLDAQDCVLEDARTITQLVMGDNGPGETLRITDGGELTLGVVWSAIGYNNTARLVVETGGQISFGEHMWVGLTPGSDGVVELNGGTINVAQMTGLGWEGGKGTVYVNEGVLNMNGFDPTNSIKDGSLIDIRDGRIVINGDQIGSVNNYVTAGKITAYGNAGEIVVSYDEGADKTTVTAQPSFGPIHSSTSAHNSYTGLSMTGYQGWFGAPNDGGTNGWRHYNGSNGFQPGSASIEYWPDMREADDEEKYETQFTFDDGSPATVFSSVHPKTVSRHFQWMKEYGIDGAFMQRFRSDWGIRPTMNKILGNAIAAAHEHGRAISLMYDIGANVHINSVPNDALRTEEVNNIFNDWKGLVDELGLTTGGEEQAYLYHNGKPLVVLWGVGFNHRHNSNGLDMAYWVELVDSLQNSPQYGNCSIMLGVPTRWRTGGGDCVSGAEHTKMLELIQSIDIIQPWHTSRFDRNQMATEFKSLVSADISWCEANGIDYTPTVSPGIREKILHSNGYELPRESGFYFWDMAKAAIEAGSKMLYLGMFDEVDEGTQYHKINNNPPFYSNSLSFQTYGNDPEDHYLWLAGEATRALRGEFTMGSSFRTRANADDFQSEIAITDNDDTYTLQLSTTAAGRKVFYANPYKVPDGAPTVGTKRDASLFANELRETAVTFTEEQRGQYIRLIEVDETTDEIISYKAIVAAHSYASIPYATGFEEGTIDPRFWSITTETDAGSVIIINTSEPNTGDYHLTLDANSNPTYTTNSADLHLNLNEIVNDIKLDFSFKLFSEEENLEDGIYFSNDAGLTFEKVFSFQGIPNVYADTSLSINELAAAAGLSLTAKFVIRFQHKDAVPIPLGGLALDDISIFFSDEQSGYAQFLNTDDETQGAWMGNYGVDGYYIVEKESNLPSYANIFWDPNSKARVWEDNSIDIRGLQYTSDSTILSAQYAETQDHPWWFSIDVGAEEQEVSLYFLDGDHQNRQFILKVVDNATGDVYDIQTVQNFQDGKWLSWKLRGKVRFVMELLEGPDAVVSGIFFHPSSPSEIQVEHSLSFDGVDDFIDCGRDESLQISGTAITVEAWFKIDSTQQSIWQSTLLAMDHSEVDNDLGYFMRANGDGQIGWGFGDGTWHEIKSADGVQLFELDTWNHVAGVYDGSFQKIYLNGNLIATSEAFTATVGVTPSENLFIGSSPYFPDRVIDARLAEIRVWNMARSDSQIKEFATQRITGDESGLAAYWPINEGQGQVIVDISANTNDGILGGAPEENELDPVWIEEDPAPALLDILEGFNGSFEDNFDFWRFYEVPNQIGSIAEIIQGDVVHGANAAKVTFVEPDDNLVDRSLDNWDSNMPLVAGKEYFVEFWAKAESPDAGQLRLAYGFFDPDRQVISEAGLWFELSGEYQKYEFSFIAPEGTDKGWLAFRWKEPVEDKFVAGVIYLDHIQLLTEALTVDVNDIDGTVSDQFELYQNFPNPFNSSTTISYKLPESAQVQLNVYDISGQRVAQLVNQKMPAGNHELVWKAEGLSNGVYFVTFRSSTAYLTKKMILLKK